MPLVKVFYRAGKSEEYCRAVAGAIHEALVAEAGVPQDDRFQVFLELAPANLVAHPSYAGVSRSEELLVVEITLNAGRSVEVKKSLYRAIARNLKGTVNLRPDDVLICLVEVQRENWSFGHGKATYAD